MAGILSGSVVRAADLQPVRDVEVTIAAAGGADSDDIVSAFSDASGSFLFSGLAPGPWTVACRWLDQMRGGLTVTVLDNALTSVQIDLPGCEGEMTEPPPTGLGSVDGRVVDAASGRPIADAAIVVVYAAAALADIAPITDALGRFALAGLPAGEWTFAAYGPAGETGEASVLVRPDKLATTIIRTY